MMKTPDSILSELVKPIVDCLNGGDVPWLVPVNVEGSWMPLSAPKRSNGKPFDGVNVQVLWAVTRRMRYQSSFWFTEHQASLLGGVVKLGQQSTKLVMYPRPKTGERIQATLYDVYNAEQLDGLHSKFLYDLLPTSEPPVGQCEVGERLVSQWIHRSFKSDVARYVPGAKMLRIPDRNTFKDPRNWYSIWFQLIPHYIGEVMPETKWKAYNRNNPMYAISEMVATMAGAYMATKVGLPTRLRNEHEEFVPLWAQYISSYPSDLLSMRKIAEAIADQYQSL